MTWPDAAAELVHRMAEQGNIPDILINCAGAREVIHPLQSADKCQHILSVNLPGTFFISQAIAPLWRDLERSGAIVNATLLASENRTAFVSRSTGSSF